MVQQAFEIDKGQRTHVEPRTCSHCGLVVYTRRDIAAPVYCCIGCAILGSALGGARGGPAADTQVVRSFILRLGLAAFFSANVMLLSLFLYSLEQPGAQPAPPLALALVRWLLLCFSVPVFAVLAPPYLAGLARDARRRRFSMDSLIAIGAGAALVYSAGSVARGAGELYFDTASMVLLLVTAGRLLEAHARRKGRRAVEDLIELQPPSARILRDGAWETIPTNAVQVGERVRVLAGERIPVDGVIEQGASAVDESMLTGEPMPAERVAAERVRAGSLCLNGVLDVRATAAASDTLLARTIASVEQAQRRRSPMERLADRAASVFVPATVLLAGAVTLAWWRVSPEKAWMAGLSVLVVACPCALGIAVPMAQTIALGAAARRGILVRSAETLERLAAVRTVAFDKTGTLTQGRVHVTQIVPAAPFGERELVSYAAAAAADSLHPVSRAVAALASPAQRRRVESFPGYGMEAELLSGEIVRLGQPRWVERFIEPVPGEWRREVDGLLAPASGVVWCAVDQRIAGALLLEDPISGEAHKAVTACRQLGLLLLLVSGDRPGAVAHAAASLSIDRAEGGLLPIEKAAYLEALPPSNRPVAMVGDGINDATALAAADVGVAVAGGTDVAREVAEVVFLEGGLGKLPLVVSLARRTRRVAIQNLAWTASYNAIALCLAAGGALRPIFAAALMLASSLFVIANSLRVPASIKNL